MTAPPTRLRRDARRNREALLEAGRQAFARHGLEAPLESVAREAGVAIGTLYRHFPSRIDLVQAILAEKVQVWLEAAERAATNPDSWAGFREFLENMCEMQADDRGLNDLASMHLPVSACLAGKQHRIFELGGQILARAQADGQVRADLTPEDLAFVIWSHTRVTEATSGIAPDAWRRHLHLLLDAFRSEGAHPLPAPPLTPEQLRQAMLRLGGAAPGCPGGDG
jgi:AcrR family transcriptional regulator